MVGINYGGYCRSSLVIRVQEQAFVMMQDNNFCIRVLISLTWFRSQIKFQIGLNWGPKLNLVGVQERLNTWDSSI